MTPIELPAVWPFGMQRPIGLRPICQDFSGAPGKPNVASTYYVDGRGQYYVEHRQFPAELSLAELITAAWFPGRGRCRLGKPDDYPT